MASNRHLGRIVAMQTLYEYEFRKLEMGADLDEILERNLHEYDENIDDKDFVRELVHNVLKRQDDIDNIIGPAAPEWPIDQIARIDLAILRIGVYELAVARDVPPKVAINEAVELAKAFGGENASKFVNGVLGTIYRKSDFYEPEEDKKNSDAT